MRSLPCYTRLSSKSKMYFHNLILKLDSTSVLSTNYADRHAAYPKSKEHSTSTDSSVTSKQTNVRSIINIEIPCVTFNCALNELNN